MVHLMSAGRLKYVPPAAKGAKTPMFRLRFADGGELQLTEAGSKKRAGVWLLRPDAAARGARASRPGGRPARRSVARHPLVRLAAAALAAPRPAADRRHRARLGERDPLGGTALALPALDAARRGADRAARDGDQGRARTRARAAPRRREGREVYRVHNRLGEPCARCGTPLARIDFEEHTIYYCPECQTGGRTLKDRRLSRLLK